MEDEILVRAIMTNGTTHQVRSVGVSLDIMLRNLKRLETKNLKIQRLKISYFGNTNEIVKELSPEV